MENIEEVFNEILMYDVQEALKYSSNGFKKSGNPEYLLYTAHCYLVQGFFEDAIAAIDLAFELGCDYIVYGYNVKGEALLSLGLYVESRRCFERVLKEEEEQYLANTFLIELDIREGLYEDAINRCVDYMENYECDNKILSDLKCIIGWTYLVNLNNPEIAREAFMESIEANKECSRSYTGLGVYEANHKRFNEAIEYFNKAIEINENDGENYFGIAICNKELNNFDVVEEYAFELLRQGRNKDAIEYFKEVLRENPSNIEIKNLILELEKSNEF